MRYKVLEIEKQLVDALKAVSSLSGVVIKICAGEINTGSLTTKEMLQTLIDMRRFILVQYQGKTSEKINSVKSDCVHKLGFRFYVGSIDVDQISNAREDAYTYLATIFDTINSKWLASIDYSLAPNLSILSGFPIVDVGVSYPYNIQVNNHGLITGDYVFVSGVLGATELNNMSNNPVWQVEVVDENNFIITDLYSLNSYTSSGTVIHGITSSEFRPQTCFIEGDGQDQKVIVDTKDILIYSADYTVKVLA